MQAFVLRLRPITRLDAETCASLLCAAHPLVPAEPTKIAATIERLIANEAMKGKLIEQCGVGSTIWTAAGLGISGFVNDDVVTAHLGRPTAFLFMQLLAGDAHKRFLQPEAIARGNAGPGLDLVLHYTQRNWDLTDPHWRAVCTLAHEAYVQDHRGYRLRRALQEDWSREPDIYLATGYRVFSDLDVPAPPYAADDPTRQPRRILYYASHEEVRKLPPGTTIANVFQYAPPRCGFTPSEQRVLVHASSGLTDEAIAETLGLTMNSIKQAWRRIYERVEKHAPVVLISVAEPPISGGGRGPEKRRHVLAFVEAHPQELRPYGKPDRS